MENEWCFSRQEAVEVSGKICEYEDHFGSVADLCLVKDKVNIGKQVRDRCPISSVRDLYTKVSSVGLWPVFELNYL